MSFGNQDINVEGPGNRIATQVSTRDAQLSTGLEPLNMDVNVTARKSVVAGEVLMFDMAQSDGAVASATIGATDSAWRNVIAPTAAGLAAGYPLCVALAIIADNAAGTVRVRGVVDADLAGTNVLGDQLVATTGGDLARALSGVGERVVAWALAAGATEQSVYFDGFGGFGAVQNPLPTGMQVPNVDFLATNRNAGTLVVGDVMMLDMDQGEETTNATLGDALSCWANVTVPTSAGVIGGYPLCVALGTPADNAVGSFRLSGIVSVNMDAAPSIGGDLTADYGGADANALTETFVAADRVCAIALSAADPALVLFQGFGSLGVVNIT